MLLPWFLAAASLQLAAAKIWENADDLKKLNMSFDFIVVGGGNAGNVVANRLSENPKYSVLVLEAGGSDAGILAIEAPLLCGLATPFTAQDWNYTTTPQAGLNNRVIQYPRGFVLGGSSSVNYLVYTTGSKEDWDRFAKVSKDDRWSWDALVPYMRKNEKFTQPVDHHNITGQINPKVHGFNGINSVSLSGLPTEIDSKVISSLGGEFPFNLDMNSGNHLGVGWTQITSLNGSRSSSSTSYLAPKYVNRPNLQVLLHAQVSRVLPTAPGAPTDFRTVEFRDGKGAFCRISTLTAKKEVVLSAGSVGTPSIMMHSGIGDSSALNKLGIKPLVNLPGVGRNLSDHALLIMAWSVDDSANTYDPIFQNSTVFAEAVAQWQTTRTGRLTQTIVPQIGWARIPQSVSSALFGNGSIPDPAAGPNTAHYEIVFSNGVVGPPPAPGKYFGITVAVTSPASRGSVTINSADPFAAPLINPNFMGDKVDLVIMREAVKAAMRFSAKPALKGYVQAAGAPVQFGSNAPTDEAIDEFIRANTATVFHPVGTAAVSPVGAKWGVLDPNLRVKGLKGLRVVDLSVLPYIISAHTQAPAYIVGERGADMIKADW
ncbi:Alcohol oxidase [Mycena kentingensis (nom. inval.)]|nr:Alcohol oxidase [Mycena kentingensis (nom. inval.)]